MRSLVPNEAARKRRPALGSGAGRGSMSGRRAYRSNSCQSPHQHPQSDGVLQLLGGAKGDLLAGLDPDGLAGGRIASHARCTVTNLQDAETCQAQPGAFLQVTGGEGHQIGEDCLGLLLRQFLLLDGLADLWCSFAPDMHHLSADVKACPSNANVRGRSGVRGH